MPSRLLFACLITSIPLTMPQNGTSWTGVLFVDAVLLTIVVACFPGPLRNVAATGRFPRWTFLGGRLHEDCGNDEDFDEELRDDDDLTKVLDDGR